MPVKKSTVAAALVGALVVTGLTGCSDGHPAKTAHGGSRGTDDRVTGASARGMAERAVRATKSARSLRMTGHLTSEGERVDVDMALARSGDCTGEADAGAKGSARIRQEDGTGYVEADDSFWKAVSHNGRNVAGASRLLKGRWLKVPQGALPSGTTEAGTDPTSLCDLGALLADLGPDRMRQASKGRKTTVDGRPAVSVVSKQDGGTTTAFIAAKGKPYLLRIAKKGGESPGVMTFGGFGKPFAVVTPPQSRTVDLAELLGVPGGKSSAHTAG